MPDEEADITLTEAVLAQFWDPNKRAYVFGPGAETTDKAEAIAHLEAYMKATRIVPGA